MLGRSIVYSERNTSWHGNARSCGQYASATSRSPGTLAQLVTAISDMGASVGTINLISETTRSVVRDITVYADNAEHMDKVVEAMHANPGTHIIEVRDEVLALHAKGKIAIRSRFPVDSVATLRRVYTPGVAEVCLKIADNPDLARLYTSVSHMVAIVTDGTAVLGLGDIGPLASYAGHGRQGHVDGNPGRSLRYAHLVEHEGS